MTHSIEDKYNILRYLIIQYFAGKGSYEQLMDLAVNENFEAYEIREPSESLPRKREVDPNQPIIVHRPPKPGKPKPRELTPRERAIELKQRRDNARRIRNWKLADDCRNALKELGYDCYDQTSGGSRLYNPKTGDLITDEDVTS